MQRKVIEDGERRVTLDKDEVIIEEGGESVSVKSGAMSRDPVHEDRARIDDDRHYETERPHRIPRRGGSNVIQAIGAVLIVAGVAVIGLLIARLVLLALDADAGNGAVDAVYDITGPLVEPFDGLFSVEQLNGGGIFEPAAAIAAGVALLAVVVVGVALNIAQAGPSRRAY
jgi:hypothetical protein